jgi:hypothetical protein
MKATDMTPNGVASKKRVDVTDIAPTQGFSNVSEGSNAATNMNAPELKERSWRTDQLVEKSGVDGFTLANEAPRMTKMKG